MKHKSHLFIVDYDRKNLNFLSRILEGEYSIHLFSSGKKIFHCALENNPDLILLNIKIAGMDGYEICRQLKADKRTYLAHESRQPLHSIKMITEGIIYWERQKPQKNKKSEKILLNLEKVIQGIDRIDTVMEQHLG